MDNHRYITLVEAAEAAAVRCSRWRFATADEVYDRNSLLGIAEIHDAENPTEEDSFYLVSPGGAIGFSDDGESIDWLFLPQNSTEDLPLTVKTQPVINFCATCGERALPGARFCGACGAKLC